MSVHFDVSPKKVENDYEEHCPKCEGWGWFWLKVMDTDGITLLGRQQTKCMKCKGTGKITWIDKIFRKGDHNVQ